MSFFRHLLKNRRVFLFCFFLSLFLWNGSFGAHAVSEEHIERLSTSITLRSDAVLDIVETIVYDFGGNERHGIYRDIPLDFIGGSGKKQRIKVDVLSITDEKGEVYEYTQSKKNGNMRIKIGDPDLFVRGQRTYVLSYEVRYALSYFSQFDELYWNALGHEWPVTTSNASVEVFFPDDLQGDDIQKSCYSGIRGSTDRCDEFGRWEGGVFRMVFPRPLASGEGVTVAFGFPKGVVYEPTWLERFSAEFFSYKALAFPLVVFIGMFVLWHRAGKDPKGRGVIIAEYTVPENLTPLEAAGLIESKVTARHVSAAIIGLAVFGYITIRKIKEKKLFFDEEEYVFLRTNKKAWHSIDEALLRGLFGKADDYGKEVRLSDLKTVFYKEIPIIEKEALVSLVTRGFFPHNPKTVLVRYILLGFLGIFACFVFFQPQEFITIISFVISFVIYFLFSLIMPKTTKTGALLKERLLGLKEYLQIAEKDRLAFHNAPEKEPKIFEELLPYAMIFGVEKSWAKEFEEIYTTPPEWYSDSSMGAFSAGSFASSLEGFQTSAGSTLSSSPGGSSGGGSSGGGGGGGGGGSW